MPIRLLRIRATHWLNRCCRFWLETVPPRIFAVWPRDSLARRPPWSEAGVWLRIGIGKRLRDSTGSSQERMLQICGIRKLCNCVQIGEPKLQVKRVMRSMRCDWSIVP